MSTSTEYPLSDLLYRSEALTDDSGEIVEAYDTDAYGNTLAYNDPGPDGLWFTDDDVPTDQPVCTYIFTGREYDPESQIYFYRARYYHPQLGRFLSRDPILFNAGMNLYFYTEGNPTIRLDFSGLDDVEPTHLPLADVIKFLWQAGPGEIGTSDPFWDLWYSNATPGRQYDVTELSWGKIVSGLASTQSMENAAANDLIKKARQAFKDVSCCDCPTKKKVSFSGKQRTNTAGIEQSYIYLRIGGFGLDWNAEGTAKCSKGSNIIMIDFKLHYDVHDTWQWDYPAMNFFLRHLLNVVILGGQWRTFGWHDYINTNISVAVPCKMKGK